MPQLRAAILAALFMFVQVPPSLAQDVTLQSLDGAIKLSGTLRGFDGEFYRLETRYGELTVDGSGVNCTGPGCPNLLNYVADLTVSGSATIGNVLMPALIEAFALREGYSAERVMPDESHFIYTLKERSTGASVARFRFRVSNTDEGFADLLADEADIAMSLREVRPTETRLASEAGIGNLQAANRSRVLALDALIPVVSPANPVTRISLRDLSLVLAGKLTNWAQLGGPDAPIGLHFLVSGNGLTQAIEDKLMRPARLTLSADATRHDTNIALDRAVGADPFGLGIVSYSEIEASRALRLTGGCGFTLRGTRRNIKTEDYPLTLPMFLYLPARRLPKMGRDFLAFTRSPAAQIVIRRAGFVDQAPEEVPIDMQGDRLANAIAIAEGGTGLDGLQRMTGTLGPMQRLTTSFRFEPGSISLDAQSRSNVQQLARSLEAGAFDARSVLFVGFSDGQGPADGNLAIARRRAENVRDAVLEAAEAANLHQTIIDTDAFGEAMPMACDDSVWGRQVNRRVEVWVR